MCWYGGLSVKCKNAMDRVVNVGGKIVGESRAYIEYIQYTLW